MDGMREAGGQCARDTDAAGTVLEHHLCVCGGVPGDAC